MENQTQLSSPDISVVLPFHNRRATIAARYAAIATALRDRSFEVIAVDDGSIDGGYAALAPIAASHACLRVVRLRRSFGLTAAQAAGVDRARGAIVVMIDGDGQMEAGDIPALLDALAAGADVAVGHRTIPRSLPTRVGNLLISAVTGVRLHDYGCPLKAYRADVVRSMRLYGSLYRLAPAIAGWYGATIVEVNVRERHVAGIGPGTGLMRVLQVLLDLLTVRFLRGYAARPMQGFGRVGLALLGAGLALGTYLAYVRLWLQIDIGERPLLLLAALLGLIGVQFLALGLLAELVVRVYFEAQQKPIYAVRDEIGASQTIESRDPAEP
ncbi:MAG: glycosyltransferase [Chloroflexi bacterium]|nr:glycosyltransferase [Chloroflexota bacterium]